MTSISQSKIEPTSGCIAAATAVLGQKWTALILRDLMAGPRHFCELERSVGQINPRTLSKRLDDLSSRGIVTLSGGTYALSPKGRDLLPTLKQMAKWGTKYPA